MAPFETFTALAFRRILRSMKNRRNMVPQYAGRIGLLLLLALFTGCRPRPSDPTTVARSAVEALSQRDWPDVAEFVHPDHGLRFTPYAMVNLARDVVVAKGDVAKLASDSQTRRWGEYDGTGEPIHLTIDGYYDRFIYDRQFSQATVGGANQRVGQGNSLNNMPEVFGDREVVFIEFHEPGTETYGGMDWRSLRIVLERLAGQWYLIGLVHDQWTI